MPYGIKNETPEMTKKMERCVSGIGGKNSRTGKPYTKGEKIAICKAALLKSKSEEITAEAESLVEILNKISQERRENSPDNPDVYGPWLVDVYTDAVIVEMDGGTYAVPWIPNSDTGDFQWDKAIKVIKKISYEAESAIDSLFGSNWLAVSGVDRHQIVYNR